MRISIVAALDEDGVIGRDGGIPWRLPDDQRFFKRLTTGHTLVMGRKTFESIGRPLPDRVSIVVTRNRDWRAEGAVVVHDFGSALDAARSRDESECFVVGGADVYALALPLADRLVLTRVEARVGGDVRFPPVDLEDGPWRKVSEERHAPDERHAHAFRIEQYERA